MKNTLILLLFFPFCLFAQKHDNIWIFGYESIANSEDFKGSIGSFISEYKMLCK